MVRKMVSLRGRLRRPYTLLDLSRDAYKVHEKCGVLPLWEKHCRPVLIKAQETTIVEQNIIESPESDVYRAWVNSIIAGVIHYHLIDYKALTPNNPMFPASLKDERLLQELKVFGQLTDLDRREADLSEYVPLLNNGDAPLALLAKIADYAITHYQHDILKDFVSDIPHPLFRLYPSLQNARECMSADAKAGMQIYAPIAELFGHPGIAGDIFQHAFHVRYPDIYKFVLEQLSDERIKEKVLFTQRIVKIITKRIENDLRREGFDCELNHRWKKHKGKIMKKVRGELDEEHEKSEKRNLTSLEEYMAQRMESYSITELHDIVAARVILDRYEGNKIDEMEKGMKKEVINKAKKIIERHIDRLIYSSGNAYSYDHKFYDKENGYKSHHFDVKPLTVSNATNFEIQLRTREWHEVSEHGKAAHFLYVLKQGKKEDSKISEEHKKFIKMIDSTYSDIIYMRKAA